MSIAHDLVSSFANAVAGVDVAPLTGPAFLPLSVA
jgi:predicted ATPase